MAIGSGLSTRLRHIIGDTLGASLVEANIEKALEAASARAAEDAGGPHTQFFDPISLFQGREWLVKATPTGTSALTFRDLRRMAQAPIIASIIQTRLNQAAAFMVPAKQLHEPGFRIVSDDPAAMEDQERIQELTQFALHCGIERMGDALLEQLARKVLRDSLVLDQMCVEIVPRRNRLPGYLVAVDAATIRRLKRSLDPTAARDGSDPHYVQVINDKKVAEYPYEQLMFGVRNPQTDIRQVGYGMSELEYLVRVVTSIINAEKYNAGLLAQGGIHKHILVVRKGPRNAEFDAFKRDYREAIRNAASYWHAPVLGIGEGAEVDLKRLDVDQKDMEYAQLFDFLVKEACGVYQIDPQEINWSIGASGVRQTLGGESGEKAESKFRHSRLKGLLPLLRFFANQLTTHVVERIDPRFRLEFVGVVDDRRKEAEIAQFQVKTWRTVNEYREDMGLEAIEGGDVILDPQFLKARDGVLSEDEMGGLLMEVGAEGGTEEGEEESGEDEDLDERMGVDDGEGRE